MKLRILLLASLCVAATSFAETAKNLAIDPKPRDAGWMKRHDSFNAISKKGEAQLVFLGDSITQGWEKNGKEVWAKTWEPLKAANFGIGGDRTEYVIWRLQNGNFDGIKPKLVVLMIGTNNTGHQGRPAVEHGGAVYASSAEQTAEGVKMILDILGKKFPETKVLLLGIFPRGATKDDAMRKQNVATNNLISGFADNKRVFYMDIGNTFLKPDGTLPKEIMPDLLHLNAQGYQMWTDAIEGKVKELMK
ncbi:MAG: GDSL family lipase [Prosthecobacter sp.]|uniref:platelet-activating factor acetylhydrolase IB subunit n=1 Tax=Prosthecobacter sp. TaxID=1965333 RepID=UPI0026243209|nr:platelet-activating factor acetylhydrolase IB subunit [Prosthecobacter sp.]MCF7789496.1 GDSL family lipase [Prosthecobacter sp.]